MNTRMLQTIIPPANSQENAARTSLQKRSFKRSTKPTMSNNTSADSPDDHRAVPYQDRHPTSTDQVPATPEHQSDDHRHR